MTPQTTLEFRIWSHHTLKADALLGRATVDLKQVLLTHNRKCKWLSNLCLFMYYFKDFKLILLKSRNEVLCCVYKELIIANGCFQNCVVIEQWAVFSHPFPTLKIIYQFFNTSYSHSFIVTRTASLIWIET